MCRLKQRLISAVAALSLLVSAVPVRADSLSSGVNAPFRSDVRFTLNGTSTTSSLYRIPAMVTLSNGNIVTAADIRWNTTYDGGGLDTLTALSSDGGVSWNYTVANYLGDNGNQHNALSTSFIDPCLVANGNTVYMLVDLYPYGVALNGGTVQPEKNTGFDGDSKLLLSDDNHNSYGYYLNLNDYLIYDYDTNNSTGIKVDPYFNYTLPSATFRMINPEESTEPTEETTEPTEETTAPTEETTAPTEETTAPTEETTAPTEETTAPTEETTAPTEETTAPTEETTAPTEETMAPTEETTAPTEETTAPTEETTAPTEETTASTGEAELSLRRGLWGGLAIRASAAEYDPDEQVVPAAETTYNLFCGDSPFKVTRTGYLYLTKSTDGGTTWSEPKLLNLKTSDEQVCLVGPGRGVTTSSGRMVIPIYSYNSGTQKFGFVYSNNGSDWYRVNATFSTPWSSESAVVELSNGDLRFFFRNGTAQLYYVDYRFGGGGWTTPMSTGIVTNSNTQISAITYSQKVDGKQVILVSCPAGPSGGSTSSSVSARTNGRIFVFTYDGSTMALKNTVEVNSGYFMYSCLTERSDGSVAILYEAASNYAMEMKAYTADELGITSGGGDEGGDEGGDVTDPSDDRTITLSVGQQISRTIADAVGTPGTYTTADEVAQYSIAHAEELTHQDSTANRGTNADYTGETVSLHQALYTFTGDNTNGFSVQNGSVYLGNLAPDNTTIGYPGTSSNAEKQVFLKSSFTTYGANAFNIKLADSDRYLYFWRDGKNRFDKQGSAAKETAFLIYAPVDGSHTSSTELPGYYQITSADQIRSGGKYLIAAYSGDYYILYPSTSTTDYYAHVVKATGTPVTCTDQTENTVVTFTGLIPGRTTVTVGDTVYTVTVNALEKSLDRHLIPNSTMTLDAMEDLGLSGSGYTVSYRLASGTGVSLDGSTGMITSGSANGSAEITATVTRNGTVCAAVTYYVTVSERLISDTQNIYLPEDGRAIISGLSGEIYGESLDTGIAAVTSGTSGLTVTGVTVGDTSVIVGTTLINIHVVPQNSKPTYEATSRYVYINIAEIENCDVYYSINGSELHEIKTSGVLMDQTYYGGFSIIFYAAPHPGHALTHMNAPGSLGNYYILTYEGHISNSSAWPLNADGTTKYNHGFRYCLEQGNVTQDRLKEAFDEAIALGCHGAQTFTRNDYNELNQNLSFRAEKLPEFSKEILGYKRSGTPSDADIANGKLNVTGYTDYFAFDSDVTLEFGDTLLYQFTVTGTSSNVEYTDITLRDDKIGFVKNISDNAYKTPGSHRYYATYTITPDDIGMYTGGKFVNNAQLSYQYHAAYSTGVYGGSASAEAACDIIGVVSYRWEEGTPEAIVRNDGNRYSLPESFSLVVGGKFRISPYEGEKTYTETVDGIDVTWTYSDEWGVQRYGSDEKTWFQVNTALDADFTMAQSRSITFYGRWLANYSVVYKWVGEHPSVSPPAIVSYQQGDTYTVDNTFPVGYAYNDGTYLWTFQGWKQSGSDTVCNGKEQTVGSAHIYYTGTWTRIPSASSLTIRKTGCSAGDENQSFLFHISGNGVELDVVIHGNGSVTVSGLSVGKTYTVTEDTDWSWRYRPANAAQTVQISSAGNTLTFNNTRSTSFWLSGGAWCDNRFNANP